MAIRIRTAGGRVVALCAAETDPTLDDLYLDDTVHQALAVKFAQDWQGRTVTWDWPEEWAVMETQKLRDAEEELTKWLAAEALREPKSGGEG